MNERKMKENSVWKFHAECNLKYAQRIDAVRGKRQTVISRRTESLHGTKSDCVGNRTHHSAHRSFCAAAQLALERQTKQNDESSPGIQLTVQITPTKTKQTKTKKLTDATNKKERE